MPQFFSNSHLLFSHHLAQLCHYKLILDSSMTFTYLLFLPETLKRKLYKKKNPKIKVTVPDLDFFKTSAGN